MSVSKFQIRSIQEKMSGHQRECPHANMTYLDRRKREMACQTCFLQASRSVFRCLRLLSKLPILIVTGAFIPMQAGCDAAGHGHPTLKGVGEVKGILRRLFECSRCRALLPKSAFGRARENSGAPPSDTAPLHRPMYGED